MLVDPNYLSHLSTSISASTAAEQSLTNELSSGLRVAKLSDDPLAVSANTLLTGQLSGLDSFIQTAGNQQGRLQVTDSTLGEVVAQLTSAISLATEGANGTLNAANLSALGQQASALRDGVLSLANTSYEGSYLFSGSRGGTQPFALDTTTSPATVAYAGDAVTSTTVTPGGHALRLNLPGLAVFDATGSSALGALNQLVSDLESGSTAGAATDAATLTAALKTVSQQRSVLGSSLSQLTTESGYAQTQATTIEAQQSTLLAADTAQVATSLQTAEVQHQALISVVAGLSQNDLFSYLK